MLIGTVGVAASILATYWKTGEPLFLVCAVALVAVACARGLVMRAYARARTTVKSNAVARRWERRYVAGAAASVGLLGIWCYVAFARTDDAVAHLISFSITIAYVIGIFGRNFGSSRSVIVQIVCAWVPMTAALVLHGGVYHWIFAGLLVLFFLAVKLIAERLRLTLLEAVVASRDMALLAERFDTALNNMPHGLCMFDAARRIVVANARLNQHLGLSAEAELKGLSPAQLVALAVDAGLVAAAQAERLTDDLNARLSGAEIHAFILEAQNGRTLEFTVQPMENGGTVLLGRGHHRAQERAGQDQSSGAVRTRSPGCRTGPSCATAWIARWPNAPRTGCARSTSSTSTSSSRSTTRSDIPVATCC